MASKPMGFAVLLILFMLASFRLPVAPLLSWSVGRMPQAVSSFICMRCGDSTLQWLLHQTELSLANANSASKVNSGHSFQFRIVLAQTNLSILQGTAISTRVSVLPVRGTPERVALFIFGAPSGLDVTLDPVSGVPSYFSTLTLAVHPLTPTGAFSISILGMDSAGLVTGAVLTLRIDSAVHDVAVVGVRSPKMATVGDLLKYNATVSNYGSLPETVNVQLLVNDTVAAESRGIVISSLSQQTVALEWNTTGYSQGTYRVSARVPAVEGERNLQNNIFNADKIVLSVRTNPVPNQTAPLVNISPGILVVAAAVGEVALALFLVMRRKDPFVRIR